MICGAETDANQLQLVDLVCEALDKGVVDGYPLRSALGLIVEGDEEVSEFVPQLALPIVFKAQKVVLQVIVGIVALLCEEICNLLVVGGHCRAIARAGAVRLSRFPSMMV